MKIKSQDRDFLKWIVKKDSLHHNCRMPRIKEREIWWAALGENIGVEINGKGHNFARPVLVYRKLNAYSFLAIPLTTQPHTGSWYVMFRHHGQSEYAVLAQIRVLSTARLYDKMGQIGNTEFELIQKGFRNLF